MTEQFHEQFSLTVAPPLISEFFSLLQQGVRVPCATGGTLDRLLSEQWGIDAGYVTERVTTIFLDHRAIDSIATTIIRGGSTLALSGAMPGLVGATMRRGGHLAAMRGAMTHHDDAVNNRDAPAWILLKLFNLLLPELGPGFLQRGILMERDELRLFLRQKPELFWQSCHEIVLNGRTTDKSAILSDTAVCATPTVLFSVLLKG